MDANQSQKISAATPNLYQHWLQSWLKNYAAVAAYLNNVLHAKPLGYGLARSPRIASLLLSAPTNSTSPAVRLSRTLSRYSLANRFSLALIKFTLKQILVLIAFSAVLSAWIASHCWIGTPKLRCISTSGCLLNADGTTIEFGSRMPCTLPNETSCVCYRCSHCQKETQVPLSGIREFSAKDFSRFSGFTHSTKRGGFVEIFDLYCSGCKRPFRVVAETEMFLGIWADSKTHGAISFYQVIESEL